MTAERRSRTTTRADLLEAVYATSPGLSRAQAREIFEMALDEICERLVAPGGRFLLLTQRVDASDRVTARLIGVQLDVVPDGIRRPEPVHGPRCQEPFRDDFS